MYTYYVLHLSRVKMRLATKMTNVTLSIDEEDLRQARVLALQQGSSLNAVIRQFVKNYVGGTQRYQEVTDRRSLTGGH